MKSIRKDRCYVKEVKKNLFVGSEIDEVSIRREPGWYVIHACKDPYHRNALGYPGKAAPKTHPEYLIARREGRLILNLVDAPNPDYVPAEIIDAAVHAIHENIGALKVLVHCNQGASRSPTIALLYLAKFTDEFDGMTYEQAVQKFRQEYPDFLPAAGMSEFAKRNWSTYSCHPPSRKQ
jgi:hypothetical protein